MDVGGGHVVDRFLSASNSTNTGDKVMLVRKNSLCGDVEDLFTAVLVVLLAPMGVMLFGRKQGFVNPLLR